MAVAIERTTKATVVINAYFDGAGRQLCYRSDIYAGAQHACPMLLWIEGPPYCQACKEKLTVTKNEEKVYASKACPLKVETKPT